jgi:hypothetical protein
MTPGAAPARAGSGAVAIAAKNIIEAQTFEHIAGRPSVGIIPAAIRPVG